MSERTVPIFQHNRTLDTTRLFRVAETENPNWSGEEVLQHSFDFSFTEGEFQNPNRPSYNPVQLSRYESLTRQEIRVDSVSSGEPASGDEKCAELNFDVTKNPHEEATRLTWMAIKWARENKDVKHMEELLRVLRENKVKLNGNCKDEKQRSVLRIAIDQKNVKLCELLLKNQVEIDDCLFHAIQQNFLDGARAILKYDKQLDIKMPSSHYYFPSFTPMILASYCGHYEIVELLYKAGHRIEFPKAEGSSWEAANERRIYCKARSTPVYITVYTEHEISRDKNDHDTMSHCMELMKIIRKNAGKEPEHSEYYDEIEADVEDYMCNILDQVRSSDELFSFFCCEFTETKNKPTPEKSLKASPQAENADIELQQKQANTDLLEDDDKQENPVFVQPSGGDKELKEPQESLQLLDDAIGMRLVKFATHFNLQQCITIINYEGAEFMRQPNMLKWLLLQLLIGLLFPILSLAYLIVPTKWIGKLIARPAICFACHMVSDLLFVILIIYNVASRSVSNDYLGAPPTFVEWLVVFWITGKWIQEFNECVNRGVWPYLADWWNINDIVQLSLMTASIVLRIIDYTQHHNDGRRIPRNEWNATECKLISEALLSWAYVFVCFQLLSLIRTVRSLGPLQVSLARMTTNILEFLFIFALVVACFAVGLSELYWYYGTPHGKEMFCKNSNTSGSCQQRILFSGVGNSLEILYWAIFGHLDLSLISLSGLHYVTENTARSLVIFYHVVVILVLINMLIAMMSKTYEDTSSNAEIEWKLHRAAVWIRFIRREAVLPPPMNILPEVRAYVNGEYPMWFRVLRRKLSYCIGKEFSREESKSLKQKWKSAILDLVRRYKYRRLVRRRARREK